MSDDLLERATRALRDVTAEPDLRSGLTRARVLDQARARYGAKRPWWRWFVPLAAVLATSSALARVAQQVFPEEVAAVWNAIAGPTPVSAPVAAPRRRAAVPASATEPEPATESAPAPATEPASDAAPVRSATSERRANRAAKVRAAPIAVAAEPAQTPALQPVESAELVLFRRAQRLQRAGDRGALAAWDAYLRVAPHGTLEPEARYNRALTLIRGGRGREAREALAPFAAGSFAGYRAREAQALIVALERDAGVGEYVDGKR